MSGTGKYRQIVDEYDQLIGHKWKEEFDPANDTYRVSALWLRNSNGEILLAQRGLAKKNGGGLWGPAVAGTLEYDETYEQNIVKEISEEIGLRGLGLRRGTKRYIEAEGRRYFCVYFYAVTNIPVEQFVLEEGAVQAVKWVSEEWLLDDVSRHPGLYVPGMADNIRSIMNDCRPSAEALSSGQNAKTVASYEANAEGYITSRTSEQSAQYCEWIVDGLGAYPKTAKIFEIGTGTGYDADYLDSLGYIVERSDAAQSFIDFNEKRGKTIVKFDVVRDDFNSTYDAIIAVNVMQHLSRDEFITAMGKVAAALNHGGYFLFSITMGDGSEEWHDDKGGARYFLNWKREDLKKVLKGAGLSVIYEKEIGYKNWIDIIVEKI